MSLKQNTNNNNSNLKSKKLVGSKLRQKGGAAEAARVAAAEAARVAEATRVTTETVRVAAEDALIDNKIIPPLSVAVFTETILDPNILNTLQEEKIIKNAHIISGKTYDGKPGRESGDIPVNNWKFRRILVDYMILYYTHASLQGEKAIIIFNGKSLYDNYEDLKYKGLQKSHVDDIILSLHQNIRNTTPFNEVDVVDINYTEEGGKEGGKEEELNKMTVTVNVTGTGTGTGTGAGTGTGTGTGFNATLIVENLKKLNELKVGGEQIFNTLKVTFEEKK